MVVHVEEELRQFRIELNHDVMQRMQKAGFDYSDLDYVDVTGEIKKSTRCDSDLVFKITNLDKLSKDLL